MYTRACFSFELKFCVDPEQDSKLASGVTLLKVCLFSSPAPMYLIVQAKFSALEVVNAL